MRRRRRKRRLRKDNHGLLAVWLGGVGTVVTYLPRSIKMVSDRSQESLKAKKKYQGKLLI